jgi:hypothetical protein
MNSKQKGNNFERDMSRKLSLWWTEGRRDDAIWRSASSGALSTVSRGRYAAQAGDFAATDDAAAPLFQRVVIEAKRGYNQMSIQDLLDTPRVSMGKSQLYLILKKLYDEFRETRKIPLLLWKRDRRELLTVTLTVSIPFAFVPGEVNLPAVGELPPIHVETWERFSSVNGIGAVIKQVVTASLPPALPLSPRQEAVLPV